jgi:DNA-binding response OmpR family regulator
MLQSTESGKSVIIRHLGIRKMTTKILVIDDDTAVTDLLAVLLRSQGFDVIATNNSTEGVNQARQHQLDMIILDLMMPEMDGWEVCRAIRTFSQVPIIVLSALNDPSMVASVLDAGADDYLTKPTPSRILVAHINRLLKRNLTGNLSAKSATDGPVTRPLPAS